MRILMGRDAGTTAATIANWPERLRSARDRILTSDKFRRWALRFPLTRPIARRRAHDLFDLCAGFVYSQVLLACVRLRLFEHLSGRPLSLAALAHRLSMTSDATLRLLDAAIALDLVSRRGDRRFGLGRLGAALVDNPGVAGMIEHHALLYADLQDPVALLRGEVGATELGRYWSYATSADAADLTDERTRSYTGLMAASQAMIAGEVLGAYDFNGHRCLLDVGGGDGSFLREVAARAKSPKLLLFDLPPVAERAQALFDSAGLSDRAQAFGGDFKSERLPEGADIASLVRVLHDHDDDVALELLCAVREALPANGTLLVAEPMSGTPGAEAVGAAYFGFYLLAMQSGRPRTPAEIETLLKEAGFDRIRLLRTNAPMLAQVMLGRTTVNPA